MIFSRASTTTRTTSTTDAAPKRIALVGHCGPDSSYLRMAVSAALRGAHVFMADDEQDLQRVLEAGVDLLLLNRQLDYGFETDQGIDLIRRLRASHPTVKTMLISNYADAQQAATDAGALPGFGKREIGSKRVTDLLRGAFAK
jgi:CheY-like chemotaxis protein